MDDFIVDSQKTVAVLMCNVFSRSDKTKRLRSSPIIDQLRLDYLNISFDEKDTLYPYDDEMDISTPVCPVKSRQIKTNILNIFKMIYVNFAQVVQVSLLRTMLSD